MTVSSAGDHSRPTAMRVKRFHPPFRRGLAAAAFGLALLGAGGASAGDAKFDGTYSISIGAFTVGRIEAETRLTSNGYAAAISGSTSGLSRLVSDARADARQFRGWVTRLPASIMRGDGVVFLREEPQHRHEFMLLGSRWTLERGAPWGNETPVTRITLVGIGTRKNDEDLRETTVASERMVFDEPPQQLVL